jgi:hypothetical protein
LHLLLLLWNIETCIERLLLLLLLLLLLEGIRTLVRRLLGDKSVLLKWLGLHRDTRTELKRRLLLHPGLSCHGLLVLLDGVKKVNQIRSRSLRGLTWFGRRRL